ncbi:protein-PII uridylyltransferase [Legionella geestiana]|uniref:Bifunctional uridylyltransferase/uridylyl-removing enzyme n=1 Tax=Legionella geestiana TaxID=45065 RepID=A0A0W0TWW0_9GAMM|nr:[protein-PII] uridylyltransferase [Legionella geestiana]KTD00158.1 protein-PII uridylyltransferase [Legionella geestiana]QBS11798.1 [protein-PII] uridylyltransferase [Legionella geestiana]QDQ40588.1 [protein-PII] uridylyltransferase [Legionella geestiana]STX53509.1 Cytosine/adenosine deaminase [Legionella geestiana]
MNRQVSALREEVKRFRESLRDRLARAPRSLRLNGELTAFTDTLLQKLFRMHHLHEGRNVTLLALGSYGRQELQLYSDVDLLLLHPPNPEPEILTNAQKFIQGCWDTGLEPGAQIGTVADLAALANDDLTLLSSLQDMRIICGSASLADALAYAIHPLHLWSSEAFYHAKRKEQEARWRKYNETACSLEPDVKLGPGGLRDLQLIQAVGKRHFGMKKLSDGIACGYLSSREYTRLLACQRFLWKVRSHLHALSNGREDRLLFDWQQPLAARFGHRDAPGSLAIEQFMKVYFRVIKQSRELSEEILQAFEEEHLAPKRLRMTPLDDKFLLCNRRIGVRSSTVFANDPGALLTLFLWLAKRPDIEGIRAETLRLIRDNLFRMDMRVLKSRRATTCFMDIIRKAPNPADILERMHASGVLGHYLPAIAAVTGQMQYDLFHAYTVDQHSLFVLRNVARFRYPATAARFPLCVERMKTVTHTEALLLAALFHDIGKGQGGCHSSKGAMEARRFALRHHLSKDETALLVWLVQHHLLMSHTAQRQDIYDPETITRFCRHIPDTEYLDCLYLLTVADICATNPTLWNSWKDSLLRELFRAAHAHLSKAVSEPDGSSQIAAKRREKALKLLKHAPKDMVCALWATFNEKYFLHESPKTLAAHAEAIVSSRHFPVVTLLPHHGEGATGVLIYMPRMDAHFTIATTVLCNQHVTIQEAYILRCANHFTLDTYVILDEKNNILCDTHRLQSIQRALVNALSAPPGSPLPQVVQRRLMRQQVHFHTKPSVIFREDKENGLTRMFLTAADRRGLLAELGHLFHAQKIILHSAKIATAGERAEDTFCVSDADNQPLSESQKALLRQKIRKTFA